MSIADDKRNVFTTIGSYNSLKELKKSSRKIDSFSSINNKNDTTSFLLDILKTVAGSTALVELIGAMFTTLIENSEPKIKEALKKQLIQTNASDALPTSFKNSGISLPVKDIDYKGKLKINPDSDTGSMLYDSTKKSFDKTSYDAILNNGGYEIYNNMSIKYIESNDSIQIIPNIDNTNPTIGEYFETYINNTEILNKKEIMTTVMDAFYGTLSSNQEKTVDQIYNELKVDIIIERVLNDEEDAYNIPSDEYNNLLTKAQELSTGIINYDLGCGLMAAELSFNDFNNLITTISGTTDPFLIGNQIGNTINQSTSGDTNSIDNTIENKETIKDSFFQGIINLFTIKMIEQSISTPQVRTLFALMSSFQNDGITSISSPDEDMKKFDVFINCVAKEISANISEFIFNITVGYLMKLLTPVIKRVIKEKINQYLGILKSLVGANKLI
jgi:hypothetical protein